jgi:hypothetical protein
LVTALCGLLLTPVVAAEGFSALVSPPRFEGEAKPGTTYRNIVEITNLSVKSEHYALRTADWELGQDGNAVFSDALAPGSCRAWVGIEAPDITIAAGAKRRYRFEVAVPVDAPVGECRFAIMLEGDPDTVKGSLAVPVAGRIGIIVYLAVGDAAPKLEILGQQVRDIQGQWLPVLSVRNTGNAHGRVEGLVDGRDAAGRSISFAPASLPILPGETREIVLTPEADTATAKPPTIAYPLTLQGRLDAGAQRIELSATLAR